MDCNTARRLIEADVDGELDLVRHLEVKAHVNGCAECARVREGMRARKVALGGGVVRFKAPSGLAGRVVGAIGEERRLKADTKASEASRDPERSRTGATQAIEPVGQASETEGAGRAVHAQAVEPIGREGGARRWATISWPLWRAAGVAASIAVALGVGYSWGGARARTGQLVEEAVSEHIRSLQFNHLSDVISTDQHTVKPWFAGKLDFAPPVVDLASAGFPLSGGRLDHLGGHPAAALVFHRRAHAINLFVWPVGPESISPGRGKMDGYHTEAWSQGGFNFLAVSEIPAAELSTFAKAFQAGNPG